MSWLILTPLLYIPSSPPQPTTLGTDAIFQLDQHPNQIIAGRLQHLVSNWMILTNDAWMHNTIQGFRIPLISPPTQTYFRELQVSRKNIDIEPGILILVGQKKIISPIQSTNLTVFLSPIFTIPKKKVNIQPEAVEQVGHKTTFQDGRCPPIG